MTNSEFGHAKCDSAGKQNNISDGQCRSPRRFLEHFAIPAMGMLEPEHSQQVHHWWLEARKLTGKDTTGFDPDASLEKRVAWCRERNIPICCGYGRFSTMMQQSDLDQTRAITQAAAAVKDFYLPPELISIDRARSGKTSRRAGLVRNTAILKLDFVSAMVVYTQSRIYRRGDETTRYIRDEVVDQGKHAFSVHGGLDTNSDFWKYSVPLQGIIDEQQLDSTAAAVVNGHLGLFHRGFSTGPVPVGYAPVVVPDAPQTRLGRPRTKLGVNPNVAALVRQGFGWVADGVPLAECVRRYNEKIATLPEADRVPYLDPRGNKKFMTCSGFRRMLENVLYKGLRTYGKNQTRWNVKADYMTQKARPGGPLAQQQCEELRIVEDDLFDRVQARLAAESKGKRGIQRNKNKGPRSLHHLVTKVFVCAACGHRLYSTKVKNTRLRCPSQRCDISLDINAQESVRGVLEKLKEMIFHNTALVDEIVRQTELMASRNDIDSFDCQLAEAERKLKTARNQFDALMQVIGTETPDPQDQETLARYRRERLEAQAEITSIKKRRDAVHQEPLDADRIRAELAGFEELLEGAASGKIGNDLVHEAAGLFRMLVGNRIEVYHEARAAKIRTCVLGRFTPTPVLTFKGDPQVDISLPSVGEPVSVYLRRPPMSDRFSDEVYHLHAVEKLSFTAIRDKMKLGRGVVYHAWRRWHEMHGLTPPDESHLRLGRPRKNPLVLPEAGTPSNPIADQSLPPTEAPPSEQVHSA